MPRYATIELIATWCAEQSMPDPADHPEAGLALVLPLLTDEGRPLIEHERLVAVAFDRSLRPIDSTVLTIGTTHQTLVDPAQVLRWVLTRQRPALGFIVAHNHPSGSAHPSREDREITRRLRVAAEAVRVTLLDHLVVGSGGAFFSFAAEGEL